jgi:hypothetical protein
MYGKIFASLYQGTLRGNAHAILVFTNLIACSDRLGNVDKHPRAIADEVGLTVDEVRAAIAYLSAPDPESRTNLEEGRRLLPLGPGRTWGWRIVTHAKYRAIRDEETRREQWRDYKARVRSRDVECPQVSTGVSVCPQDPPRSTHAEADADADTDTPAAAAAVVTRPPANGDGARQAIQGFNRRKIQAAVASGDPLAVIGAAGGARDEQRDAEWLRDADGMSVGELVAVLWCAMHDRSAIRQPSGLRARRAEWQTWPIEDRRDILRQAFTDLGIPIPGPRRPQAEGDGEARASA